MEFELKKRENSNEIFSHEMHMLNIHGHELPLIFMVIENAPCKCFNL